jgi:hypothetical protein
MAQCYLMALSILFYGWAGKWGFSDRLQYCFQ